MEDDVKVPQRSKDLQMYCVGWDFKKAAFVNDKKWRRLQLSRFLRDYPQFRTNPSKVLE